MSYWDSLTSLWSGPAGSSNTMSNSSTTPSSSSTPVGNGQVVVKDNSGQMQSLLIELVSMTVSYGLLFAGMRYFMKDMDPMRKQKDAARKNKRLLMEKLIANGRQPFEMNDYESIIGSDLIYPEDIDVDFSNIGGLNYVKQEIFDIVALPLQRPDLFQGRSSLLRTPKGILLYGPPGTGKTMMAKAIAKESGAAFINLQMSTTMNKWFGESQKLIRATFSLAWKLAPCVIFIDEIDSFLRERTSDDHAAQGNMKAEFMALWDGLLTSDIPHSNLPYGVIVIGATNRPWDVDQAILRRMPRTFKLDLPNTAQRLDILQLFLKNERLDSELKKNLSSLAAALEGYSGSDIKELCQAAAMRPFREFAATCRATQNPNLKGELRDLSLKDFKDSMADVRATGQAAREYQDETDMHMPQEQQRKQAELLNNVLRAFAEHQQGAENLD